MLGTGTILHLKLGSTVLQNVSFAPEQPLTLKLRMTRSGEFPSPDRATSAAQTAHI
jgi:hypothetical protein